MERDKVPHRHFFFFTCSRASRNEQFDLSTVSYSTCMFQRFNVRVQRKFLFGCKIIFQIPKSVCLLCMTDAVVRVGKGNGFRRSRVGHSRSWRELRAIAAVVIIHCVYYKAHKLRVDESCTQHTAKYTM